MQEILQILGHNSGKMQEELEKNTHVIDSQRLELKNLQKFLEAEKDKNVILKTELQEKQKKIEKYKMTILNMQEVLGEQSKKKEDELEKKILNLKEHIAKLELAYKEERKRKKRKRTQDSSSSSSSSDSSSDSETEAKKRKSSQSGQEHEETENLPGSPNKVSDGENTTGSLTEELKATEAVQITVLEEQEEVV